MEEKQFTVGQWKQFTQWRCKLCPWDTLEGEAAMREHLATVHAPKAPRLRESGLVDAAGNPILVQEE